VDPRRIEGILHALAIPHNDLKHDLKQDGRQISAGRFVIKPHGHQGHGLNYSHAHIEAPAEQSGITGGNKNSRSAKFGCRRDEYLQVVIGLANCMAATSAFGKSGGKLCLLASVAKALKQIRPHTSASGGVAGRITVDGRSLVTF
jgi:hypothetical protein